MTRRRLVAVVAAVLFAAVLVSVLVYTHQMAEVLRQDAAVFSRLYALTFRAGALDPEAEERLTAETLQITLREVQRLQIPVVFTDTSGTPTGSWAHLPFDAEADDPEDLRRVEAYARELDREIPPLEFSGLDLEVHLGEPLFLRRLKWIPWVQAALLLAVVGGGAWLIFTSFRSERERIWSAMARESAHQMGTPLSSLVGWLEQLERRRDREAETGTDALVSGTGGEAGAGAEAPSGGMAGTGELDLVAEMQADVERLQKVSRRFELIGRKPRLEPVSVAEILERLRLYFSRRLPSLGGSVEVVIEVPPEAPAVRGNATLLEWAFENLIKNALDALAGVDGRIGFAYLGREGNRAVFRVYDTGPGVPQEIRGDLFEIGVSTKERGWGVGLSLTRRIIEDMHDGGIQLEATDGGASFRIELPAAPSGAAGDGPGGEEAGRDG